MQPANSRVTVMIIITCFTGSRGSIVSAYEPEEALVSSPAANTTDLLTSSAATKQHAYVFPKDPTGEKIPLSMVPKKRLRVRAALFRCCHTALYMSYRHYYAIQTPFKLSTGSTSESNQTIRSLDPQLLLIMLVSCELALSDALIGLIFGRQDGKEKYPRRWVILPPFI
eukprot:3993537-Pyramimonas_sp.AAC.1